MCQNHVLVVKGDPISCTNTVMLAGDNNTEVEITDAAEGTILGFAGCLSYVCTGDGLFVSSAEKSCSVSMQGGDEVVTRTVTIN